MLHVSPIALISSLGGYKFDGSGLFDGTSGHLNRTFSAGDTQQFIFEAIFQPSKVGTSNTGVLFSAACGGGGQNQIVLNDGGITFALENNTGAANDGFLKTTAVFKDYNAFYHILVVLDTPNATSSDRMRIYVNGTRITSFSSETQPSQNYNALGFNTATAHEIGENIVNTGRYSGGYGSRFALYDGQTMTDPVTDGFGNFIIGTQNIGWEISDVSGKTFGTNGFLIEGQNVATGTDTSGNSNSFSKTGTITAVNQAPTDDGSDVGNFAVLNLLNKTSGVTLSNGNLEYDSSTSAQNVYATLASSTEKIVAEFTIDALSGSNPRCAIGVMDASTALGGTLLAMFRNNGTKDLDGSNSAYGSSYSATDVIRCEADPVAKEVEFFIDGVSQGTMTYTASPDAITFAIRGLEDTIGITCNFGQTAFVGTPTTGFKALATQNLSDGGTITSGTNDANDFVYTGGVCETVTWNSVEYDIDTHDNSVIEFYSNGFIPLSGGTSVSWTATIRLALSVAGVNQIRGQING